MVLSCDKFALGVGLGVMSAIAATVSRKPTCLAALGLGTIVPPEVAERCGKCCVRAHSSPPEGHPLKQKQRNGAWSKNDAPNNRRTFAIAGLCTTKGTPINGCPPVELPTWGKPASAAEGDGTCACCYLTITRLLNGVDAASRAARNMLTSDGTVTDLSTRNAPAVKLAIQEGYRGATLIVKSESTQKPRKKRAALKPPPEPPTQRQKTVPTLASGPAATPSDARKPPLEPPTQRQKTVSALATGPAATPSAAPLAVPETTVENADVQELRENNQQLREKLRVAELQRAEREKLEQSSLRDLGTDFLDDETEAAAPHQIAAAKVARKHQRLHTRTERAVKRAKSAQEELEVRRKADKRQKELLNKYDSKLAWGEHVDPDEITVSSRLETETHPGDDCARLDELETEDYTMLVDVANLVENGAAPSNGVRGVLDTTRDVRNAQNVPEDEQLVRARKVAEVRSRLQDAEINKTIFFMVRQKGPCSPPQPTRPHLTSRLTSAGYMPTRPETASLPWVTCTSF